MMNVTRKIRTQMGILPLALFVVCFVGEVLAAGPYYLVSSASNVDGPFTDATKWEDAEGQSSEIFDSTAEYIVKDSLILRSYNTTWDKKTFGGKTLSIGAIGGTSGTMYDYTATNPDGKVDTAGAYFNQLILANGTIETKSNSDRIFNLFGPVTVAGENNYVKAGYAGADIRFHGPLSVNSAESDRIRFAGSNAMTIRFKDTESTFGGVLRVEVAGSTLDLSGTKMSVYADMLKGTAIRVDAETEVRRVYFRAKDSDAACILKFGGVDRFPGSLKVKTTFASDSFNNTSPYSCSRPISLVLDKTFRMPVGSDRVVVLTVPAQSSTKAINTDMLNQVFSLDASALQNPEDYSLALDADSTWKRIYVCRKLKGLMVLFK